MKKVCIEDNVKSCYEWMIRVRFQRTIEDPFEVKVFCYSFQMRGFKGRTLFYKINKNFSFWLKFVEKCQIFLRNSIHRQKYRWNWGTNASKIYFKCCPELSDKQIAWNMDSLLCISVFLCLKAILIKCKIKYLAFWFQKVLLRDYCENLIELTK